MVDVGGKPETARTAVAEAFVAIGAAGRRAITRREIRKGDPLQTARVAGIMAAKRTADLIPLCHPLPLSHVDVSLQVGEGRVEIVASAETTAQTGVEMEALTAVSVAALTVYDMAKAIDKDMTITDVTLVEKTKVEV
jgi:cyclic pyranopterin phosphate synthase